ncbi:response regulator transcription factor [Streptomyces lushanensis]|uniref:response regulator transcription factor n=1 Tax=Streptomyces lushanensis TaxID=1434255 RepID=UPI00099FC229|nr:response regulator transcription factor [Streptomyces lushanensis]
MAGNTSLRAHRVPARRGRHFQQLRQAGSEAPTAQTSEAPRGWRVLVVESDPEEADPLIRGLQRQGHRVASAETGSGALRAYKEADLLLLDLDLPDLDGLEVCRTIRRVDDIPVIAVTARGSELDRVLGLQAGADDYLVKPYGFRELMARMEAVMRRLKPQSALSAGGVASHGALRIDTESRKVTLGGRLLDLTPKEFNLLYLLVSNPGDIIPREQLMQEVWAGSWSRRTLDTHVCSLRHKLGSNDWILTVRGVGFQIGSG